MKTRTIHITNQHIKTAVKKNAHHCMIADAIRKEIPSARYIHVDLQSVRFSDPMVGIRYKYFTPPVAQLALVNFDQGQEVKPFTMTLTEGKYSPCGLAATHPNFKRKHKYPETRKKRINPKADRQFGICALVK